MTTIVVIGAIVAPSTTMGTNAPNCMIEIDPAYVSTFEKTRDSLEEVERNLASRYQISKRRPRAELLRRYRNGTLQEDELVAEWMGLYSSYLDWMREESWDPPHDIEDQKLEAGAFCAE